MSVRVLTLTDDPEQALQDLNAAFDGTTQTDLKAASATNVTTNINSHAITDIFESDGVTVKLATTGPSSCIGFLYLLTDAPYVGTSLVRSQGASDDGTWITVGPTDSGATVIWTALDSVPTSARAILINVLAYAIAYPTASGNFAYIRVRFKKYDSSVDPDYALEANACYAGSAVSHTDKVSTNVTLSIDSSRKFQFYWAENYTTDSSDYLRMYLQGYYI